MKRLSMCVLVVVLCHFFISPGVTSATEIIRSIHVEWGYTPPSEPTVTGFKLYQEGVHVTTWTGASTTAGDTVVVITTQTTNYTLTAEFNDNTESPHSAPFAFSVSDFRPATVEELEELISKGLVPPGTKKVMVASIFMSAKG